MFKISRWDYYLRRIMEFNYIEDEIISIEYLGEQETIDIETDGNHLFYANGILTHNSGYEEIEFDASHTAGGISKVYTADNAIAIYTTNTMKENGKYQLQLMKTRSSSGVGSKLDLKYDKITMRISDADEQTNDAEFNNSKSILDQLRKRNITKESSEKTTTSDSNVISDGSRLREMLKKLE